MIGPCAKKVVTCTIIAEDGELFFGENSCNNAQSSCPRVGALYSRDDFTLCKVVCDQPGHAEVMALKSAGEKARGATAFVYHHRVCSDCREKLIAAGIIEIFTI
jgi:pyrimidine deaminase RibD-like protein